MPYVRYVMLLLYMCLDTIMVNALIHNAPASVYRPNSYGLVKVIIRVMNAIYR